MKTYTLFRIILILSFATGLSACQKSSDNQPDPSKDKRCYVSRTQSGNSITDYFYTTDHVLQKTELYIAGNHGTRNVSEIILNPSIGSYTINFDSYVADVKQAHTYATAVIGTGNSIESITYYDCDNCTITNPKPYHVSRSDHFIYGAGQKLTRYENYDQTNYLTNLSTLEYDAKGRLSKVIDYEGIDVLVRTIVYQYAANDKDNYSTGESDIFTESIFHGSRSIQPLSYTIYDDDGNVYNKIDFTNTSNAEGYLASSVMRNAGTIVNSTDYTYECFDK